MVIDASVHLDIAVEATPLGQPVLVATVDALIFQTEITARVFVS